MVGHVRVVSARQGRVDAPEQTRIGQPIRRNGELADDGDPGFPGLTTAHAAEPRRQNFRDALRIRARRELTAQVRRRKNRTLRLAHTLHTYGSVFTLTA